MKNKIYNFLKGTFTISGYLLNDNGEGVEGDVWVDGYQGNPVYVTGKDGYFIFQFYPVYIWDFLFKHFLMIGVRVGPKTFQGKMGYSLRFSPNTHMKLKIYPYTKKVEINTK